MRAITGVVIVLLLMLFTGGVAVGAEETADAILTKVVQAWDKLDSLEVTTSMDFFSPDVLQGKPSSLGVLDYKKIDGVGKYRLICTVQMPTADKVRSTDYDYLYDGIALYTIVIRENEVQALKTPLSQLGSAPPGGPFLVDFIKERFVLTPEADGEIDGRPVYVIKSTQKPNAKEVVPDGRFYFDKETGLCVKMEFGREERGPYIVFHYTDMKINPSIPDNKFTFVLPEGVTLINAFDKPEPEEEAPVAEAPAAQEPAATEAPAAEAPAAQEPVATEAPAAEAQQEAAPAPEEKKASE